MPITNVLPRDESVRTLVAEDHRIGTILVEKGKLKLSDIDRIVDFHHKSGVRFGEAARRLGLLNDDDLQAALSRQYDLPQLLPANEGPSPELVAAHLPFHPLAEEMRGLRTQLLLRWLDPAAGRRVLAVISPGNGDGRSYVVANLAVVFSQLGLRTLLIDADLRKPRLHRIFNVPDRVGLAGVLAGRAGSEAVAPVHGFPKLFLLPAGAPPPNPQELLSRLDLDNLLEEFANSFDLVLMDTSAANVSSDAKSVAFRAKSALVLTRRNYTRVDETNNMIRELNETGTRIVGTVINSF